MKTEISVVVCTRNRINYLKDCIVSLLSQSVKPKEIIIVDDASEGNFLESLNSSVANTAGIEGNSKIVYLRNKKREGVTKSRNLGVVASSSDIVAFIDDDGYAHKHWLRNLSKHYMHKGVLAVGGPVIEVGRRVTVTKNVKRLSFITQRGDIVHNYRIKNINEAKRLRMSSVRFLMGGNMSFRKDVLLKLKGFDTTYIGNAYREETDICLRVSRQGKIIFEPAAVTYHNTANSGGTRDVSEMAQFLYWYFRNTTILFLKHLDFWNATRKIYFQIRKFYVASLRNTMKINRDYLIKQHPLRYISAIFHGALSGFFISKNRIKQVHYEWPVDILILGIKKFDGTPRFVIEKDIAIHLQILMRLIGARTAGH